ncbi:MAG: type II secretion system F family protein [Candidatus Yanofskybacteria bacterium]|nr:type II secretion system F family protein [Candidatus Yanofskybacteria bacterium]
MNFKYKVKTQTGEILEGSVEAPDENVAVTTLQSKGYTILSLEATDKGILSSDISKYFSKISNKDVVLFTRQLSTLIDADMPLAEGLRTLAKQVEKPQFRKVLTDVSEAVESGQSLSASLAVHPELFGSFYIKLVQSGEVSGKLHESLLYLADYLERSQSINSKIRGALAYPAFVVFALLVVTSIMVVYVLPQLLSVFKDIGDVQLPITTRMLIWVTAFVNKYLIILVPFLLALIVGFWRYIGTSSGRAWLDNLKITMPSLGVVVRSLYLARISESLSTLIKSGIPILDALHITSELVGNINYQKILLDAEENVRGGGTISESFSKYAEIPPLTTSMVAIGEKTGKLDFMLTHISKYYKSESENAIGSISQLIEPILVLLLGVAVAILVSAILLPIYNLVGVS